MISINFNTLLQATSARATKLKEQIQESLAYLSTRSRSSDEDFLDSKFTLNRNLYLLYFNMKFFPDFEQAKVVKKGIEFERETLTTYSNYLFFSSQFQAMVEHHKFLCMFTTCHRMNNLDILSSVTKIDGKKAGY